MCAAYLVFGGFGVAYCSKCAQLISRLEGCGWFGAPNVVNMSRVWRVVASLVLQTWGICLVFGGFTVVQRSKRGEFISRLERFLAFIHN